MNFSRLLMYKVVEFPQGIIILHQHDELKRADATSLIVADSETLVEYLARYLHAREAGGDMKTAHKIALKGACIASVGDLDKEPTSQ